MSSSPYADMDRLRAQRGDQQDGSGRPLPRRHWTAWVCSAQGVDPRSFGVHDRRSRRRLGGSSASRTKRVRPGL
jgi:hypothetical protein